MFKRILIPLDGSELAERALAPGLAMASKFGSEVLLLRVVVPEEAFAAVPALTAQVHNLREADSRRQEDEAEDYLAGIRTAWRGQDLPIRTATLRGTPPAMIVAVASEQGVDLIVMSTHGRTGLSRFVYGSVAEAVMRGAHIPVLLVPNKT